MNKKLTNLTLTLILIVVAFAIPTISNSQTMSEDINNVFNEVLNIELSDSASGHGTHFNLANVASSQRVINTFSTLLGVATSSFPLSSTSSGLSFEFVGGKVVGTQTSAGPIFGETGKTLGKGALNVGMNITNFSLNKFRGINTNDLVINLLHEDLAPSGLGQPSTELDFISLNMNLDVDVRVAAIYAGYGVTEKLDVAIAIPLVTVSINAEPVATMNSVSFANNGSALHFFGDSALSPILTLNPTPISSSKTGIGDIAVRVKYNLSSTDKWSWAFLGEVRLATGDEENFLGAGDGSFKGMIVGSYEYGSITPHINLAYDNRTSDFDRNEIELILGYDQMISPKLTLAAEWSGEFEIGDQITELQFDEPAPVGPSILGEQFVTTYYPSTNLPSFENDHITNFAFGFKYLPKTNFLVIANVTVPTNSGGLRSTVAPTIGFQYSF